MNSPEDIDNEIARLMGDPNALRGERIPSSNWFSPSDPNQPPMPARQPYGGQWTSAAGTNAPAELAQAQQQPGLSQIEIDRICALDPAKVAADFANPFMPGVGRVDPMTGQVRTLDWVRQQAYEMEQTIRKIQQQLCRLA